MENQDLQEGEECLALMDPLDPKVKMVIEVKLDQQVQRVNLEILEDLVHLDFKVCEVCLEEWEEEVQEV